MNVPAPSTRTSNWIKADVPGWIDGTDAETDEPITVAAPSNQLLRSLTGTALQGLNTVRWDMRDSGGRIQPRGDYLVTVDIDGRKFAKTARIRHPG